MFSVERTENNKKLALRVCGVQYLNQTLLIMDTNQLSSQIIGAAIEVHKTLGPGLLESAYEECSCHELNLRGLTLIWPQKGTKITKMKFYT